MIDANQAGGANQGVQYAAAPQVQATITISAPTAAGVPSLLATQTNWLGALTGGAFGGEAAAGTSFAVNANGQAILGTSYGKTVVISDPKTGQLTPLGPAWGNNIGGVTLDPHGNLYISATGNPIVAKLPLVNGTFAALTDPTGSTQPPNCTGSDTTECLVTALSNQASIGGAAALAFDPNGNLFVVTVKGNNPFAIFECTAACLTSGTPAAKLLFQEPASASPSTTGQLSIGGLAADPWGNLFFTDSSLVSTGSAESAFSNLKELPYTSGTGYAATPTVLADLHQHHTFKLRR